MSIWIENFLTDKSFQGYEINFYKGTIFSFVDTTPSHSMSLSYLLYTFPLVPIAPTEK